MNPSRQRVTLRQKKLSILIYDARLSERRSVDDCAKAMGVSIDTYRQFEAGQKSPSLPEIEALACYLNVPMQHFWGNQSRSELPPPEFDAAKIEQLHTLRDKIIGVMIRQERTRAGISIEDLAQLTVIESQTLDRYETGSESIPLPELEAITEVLDMKINTLFDPGGEVGQWHVRQEISDQLGDMPADLKDFVSKPVNIPYLNLAKRISDLSAEKLRSIAESLLEITY